LLSLSAKSRIRSNKQLLFDHLTCSRELNREGIRIDPGLMHAEAGFMGKLWETLLTQQMTSGGVWAKK
jgi:hypothetical protein